jgi:Tfp pilus assembly protein PilN
MRAVNLLPKEAPQKSSVKKEQVPFIVGGCVALIATALLASQYLSKSGKVASERQTLQDLKAQLAAMPAPPPGPTPTETKLVGEQQLRLTALQTALGSRVAWDRVLREFSLVLPDDVWIRRLTLKSPVSPATNQPPDTSGGATGFIIEGSTYSHDAVARLLSRLSVVADLTDVQLVNSTVSEDQGQKTVTFNIAANIKAAPPAKATS